MVARESQNISAWLMFAAARRLLIVAAATSRSQISRVIRGSSLDIRPVSSRPFANHYCDVGDALEIFLDEGNSQLRPFVFGIDDALEGLNMLEAIANSSAEKLWVSVKR